MTYLNYYDMQKRVVVTGLGVVSPIGNSISEFISSLKQGKSGIKQLEELKNLGFACTVGGVPDINGKKYEEILSAYQLEDADLAIKYAVIAGLEAWSDSGLAIPDNLYGSSMDNYGTIIGTCSGGFEIFARKVISMVNDGKVKRLGSRIIENIMPSGPAAAISNIFALSNISYTNSSACSTGSESIALSFERIRSGNADIIITGGTDPYSPHVWAGFDSMRLLSRTHNDMPEKASRPLSASSGGFVPGAGAGIIILEELEHAKKRGARIYAEIVGSNINSGGQRNGGSMTASNPESVVKCIMKAIEDAGINGNEIDLICGHLTGTKSDSNEINNWITALNLLSRFPYINSLKSLTGHLIGAAGAVETIAGIIQLNENFIHVSANCEDLNPDIESIYPREKIPMTTINDINIRYVAKASFGFGDVNSCLILKKH